MLNKLLFCVLINCSGNLLGQAVQPENELLWEISGNGLKTKSYLYGSLHSNDKRIFNFSDSTYFALNKVESIVLETDLFSLFEEWDTRQDDVRLLIDNKGKPYTGSDEPTKTIYGDEDGMPQFLDAYFLDYCYNAEKKFYPLEQVKD
ncbi:MAG: TraB/GumN family protein, partial [Flavobacteriia bacterium]